MRNVNQDHETVILKVMLPLVRRRLLRIDESHGGWM